MPDICISKEDRQMAVLHHHPTRLYNGSNHVASLTGSQLVKPLPFLLTFMDKWSQVVNRGQRKGPLKKSQPVPIGKSQACYSIANHTSNPTPSSNLIYLSTLSLTISKMHELLPPGMPWGRKIAAQGTPTQVSLNFTSLPKLVW